MESTTWIRYGIADFFDVEIFAVLLRVSRLPAGRVIQENIPAE
jgi:hypothetical protein